MFMKVNYFTRYTTKMVKCCVIMLHWPVPHAMKVMRCYECGHSNLNLILFGSQDVQVGSILVCILFYTHLPMYRGLLL